MNPTQIRHFFCVQAPTQNRNQIVVMTSDITEHRLLEQQLQQNQKKLEKAAEVKSRFLANMSHGGEISIIFDLLFLTEIRTPLVGIMGCMNLLGEGTLSSEQLNMVRIAQTCGKYNRSRSIT
jgi:signal transduction histidine kinase